MILGEGRARIQGEGFKLIWRIGVGNRKPSCGKLKWDVCPVSWSFTQKQK